MRRRTPFVWLEHQQIDHSAGFATLRGSPLRREGEGVNRWVLARGRFEASHEDNRPNLGVMVDGRYRLWLNGSAIGRGPVRASPHYARFDNYELAVEGGANVLAMLVHVPGVDLAWYEMMRGAWQPVFGDGGIFAELVFAGHRAEIEWRIRETHAWRRGTARSGWGQDFIEDFDARLLCADWITPAFDDSGWSPARAMVSSGSPDEAARGFGRAEPFPALLASEIPQAEETPVSPSRLVWIRSATGGNDAAPEMRLLMEHLGGDASDLVENQTALLRDDESTALIRTEGGNATALMFGFDVRHAGRPFVELDAVGGEVIEIAVAEALPGEYGIGEAGDGLHQHDHLSVAHVFRYIARPGRQCFEKFNLASIGAMQVVVRDAPAGVAIRRLGSMASHYPARNEGSFECSDELLNRLWQVGRHTVLQCMHDTWVDCPGREARQWVGDAVVEFDIAALAFGPSVYPLQRQFLHQAAESQRADGLVRMFAPGDIAADALVIPDFSLLWVIAVERYSKQSGDSEIATALLPAIARALAWFERHVGENGLLTDLPHWHFIEWANLGRTGESAPVNALYAGALEAAAALADAAGWAGYANRCRSRRAAVAAAFDSRHWCEQRRAYVDSVDPSTGIKGARVSQHANALSLLFDLAPPSRREAIAATISDVGRLKLTAVPPIVPTALAFEEATDVVRANTFYSHFVYAGLASASRFDWVVSDIRRNYGPMLATGTTTLWESFTPNASLCHGFSATPVYQLSRHSLGISPLAPGYAVFAITPEPADLDWARGVVPTPAGSIEVEWRIQGHVMQVSVGHPGKCRPVVAPPQGWRLAEERRGEAKMDVRFERSAS